jgi:hypothetical protein
MYGLTHCCCILNSDRPFLHERICRWYSTNAGNLGGVRLVTQKALHKMIGQRVVPYQEAAHMVDNQDLYICSETITHVSLQQGAELPDQDKRESKDIITKYRNRPRKYHYMSLEKYFYKVFCHETFTRDNEVERTKHRMLIPKGMNCRPRYPIDYNYAKGMLVLHKPWHKGKNFKKLLKIFRNKDKTIETFKKMIEKKQLPTSVIAQYICAMKYAHQKKIEIIAKEGTAQPIYPDTLDEEGREQYLAFQHATHFTENYHPNNKIDGMTVDVGEDIDWTEQRFQGDRDIQIQGEDWMQYTRDNFYRTLSKQASSKTDIVVPLKKDGTEYSVDGNSEQQQIVYRVVDTVVKFLTNDPSYRPLRATIMGCGGTGKSYVINTIISMIRKLTSCNNSVQIAAPSGAAAYNVQGSTIHRLLRVGVRNPEKKLSDKFKALLTKQLERLLVLVIDERSQVNSKVLAAAERNVRECIYNGQNSKECFGGLPVVLLFGDDYQLMPIIEEGAIQGYAKRQEGTEQYITDKMSPAQLLAFHGSYLFAEVMTEHVFCLTKNYRVKCERFRKLLHRVRKGRPTKQDALNIMKLHLTYYEPDKQFMTHIENHKKTIYLYTNNDDVDRKNNEKLVDVSRERKVPVARLQCWCETNKLQNGKERRAVMSHFDHSSYVASTDICVGSRVSIKTVNYLPEVGLYNGAIGSVIEIVYKDKPVGPNDKQHDHLPDYVVVDFPHLNLPKTIRPWDLNNPTVSHRRNRTRINSLPASHFLYHAHQHVPIPMRTLVCNRRACCTVKYCPLVPSWATTIHKFQGFEAGSEQTDMFRYLIIDPGNLKWEQQCPGALYVALSRAKYMGKYWPDTAHPKDSNIYWRGQDISEYRIRHGALKKGDKAGSPMVKCKLIEKRERWVTYLTKKQTQTNTIDFTSGDIKRMKKIRYSQDDIKNSIANIIFTPNDDWLALKKEKYTVDESFFHT